MKFGVITNITASFRRKHALLKSCQSLQGQRTLFHSTLTCRNVSYIKTIKTLQRKKNLYFCHQLFVIFMKRMFFFFNVFHQL